MAARQALRVLPARDPPVPQVRAPRASPGLPVLQAPQAPDLNDPIIPEDVDDPAPSETIYTKKARSKSGYQELLEDDFEVVDFSKKK